MSNWSKWLWGGMGWAMFGPIGGIMGYALGAMSENTAQFNSQYTKNINNAKTQGGDFGSALLILFAAVMKADNKLKKSELEYVKKFFIQHFGHKFAKNRILLFQEILKQEYPLNDICRQIKTHMDHPSRLQMIHILFELSKADGEVHASEVEIINRISSYLGISNIDFKSIHAMFFKDTKSAYKILEISSEASDNEVKKAFRKMAIKFHPDKVHHLGEEFQKMAEEKFKAVNDAYEEIKKSRQIN